MTNQTRRTILILLTALMMLILIMGGLIYLLAGDDIIAAGKRAVLRISVILRENELDQRVSDDQTPIRFTVQPGDNANTIGQRLEANGIIHDAGLFADYVQAEGFDADLDAGTYFLNPSMTLREVAQELRDSSFSTIVFTIVPGQRIEQIAETIDATAPYFTFSGAEFMGFVGAGAQIPYEFAQRNGIPSGASLEGFLLPNTYQLPPEINAQELRDMLLETFDAAITADMRATAAADGYTIYEIVTLASIIEREAVYADEHPVIASVYRNRLETPGWRLEADPTVQYGHPNAGPSNWWPRISVADYRSVNSAYNTYIHDGLPPGPIASPSLSAIQAAITPMETPYFFFRADCRGDNRHDFAITYEEHIANGC
ncbi:MAG: endolytic transglycosylase MltG [Phototrophicales bacterium]|nr:MAG: endolytic transglycosylase MltG [Phototrophicales bacterium]RMG75186.1 MAG: endolytic transglycosylase MltG [Chloroflexota bacterium]